MGDMPGAAIGPETGLRVTPTSMTRVLATFLSHFAPNSRVTMRYALSRIASDLEMLSADGKIDDLPWHTVTADHLADLVEVWRGEGLSTPTIRLYMHALRGLSRACMLKGLISSEQYLHLKEVKLPRGSNRVGRGRAVETAYRNQLLKHCMDDERVQGVRDAALIALLFGSGVRRAEAASVLAKNVNLDEAEMHLKVKGGDSVTKYLQAWAIPFLRAWQEVRISRELLDGPFFCGISKSGKLNAKALSGRGIFWLLEQRSIKAGLPFLVRPHDGRRTVGTSIISDHGELIAQRVLGHRALSTTAIYDRRSDKVIKDIFEGKTQ
ncbi:Tyrosine recombinase XerC [Stutzerimonas stutzeri]